jgi:hypothetical protein
MIEEPAINDEIKAEKLRQILNLTALFKKKFNKVISLQFGAIKRLLQIGVKKGRSRKSEF